MSAANIYAIFLALLGGWGVFASASAYKDAPGWSARRWQLFLTWLLFEVSCLGIAAALWLGKFRTPMLWLLGASYALMIPLPCYFGAVDRIAWVRVTRNIVFAAIAGFCLLAGAGLLAVPGL